MQVEMECHFGVGEVASEGIKTKTKEEAGGHTEWIMVKVRCPSELWCVFVFTFPTVGSMNFVLD